MLGPEVEFAAAADPRVAGDDALGQGRARARHAEDQDGCRVVAADRPVVGEEFASEARDQPIDLSFELIAVEPAQTIPNSVRGIEVAASRSA